MAKIDELSDDQEMINLLTAMLADYTAIRAEVVKLVADVASHRTKVNAIITAAATNIAAVAAVEAQGAGTAANPAALTVLAS